MAIILNDNLDIRAPKSTDNRYVNGGVFPYISVAEVTSTIPESYRHIGLTVNIQGEEYWFKEGVTDSDLVLKSSFDNSAFTGYTATTEIRLQNIEQSIDDVVLEFSSFSAQTNNVISSIQSDISYLSGVTDGKQDKLTAGAGISATALNQNKLQLDLSNYSSSSSINISITGTTHDFIFHDNSVVKRGIEYGANYHSTYSLRSLVDKEYVDNLISGLDAKNSVKYATTEVDTGFISIDINTLSGGTGIINGSYALLDDDRVLVKNQANPAENGIYRYVISTNRLVRTSDFDSVGEINNGAFTTVISGSNANTAWIMTSPTVETIGSDPIEWSVFAIPVSGIVEIINVGSGEGVYSGTSGNFAYLKSLVAGSGVTITSNDEEIIINANVTGSTKLINVGGGEGQIFSGTSESESYIRTLTAGDNMTIVTSGDTIVLNSYSGIENVGDGEGEVFSGIVGEKSQLRTLKAGDGIDITTSGNTVVFSTNVTPVNEKTVEITTLENYLVPASATSNSYFASGTTQYLLPETPVQGAEVTFNDFLGSAYITPITISGNGKQVHGDTYALINTDFGSITLVFNGISWNVTAFVP